MTKIQSTIDSDRIGYGYRYCELPKHFAKAKELIEQQCGVKDVTITRVKETPAGFFSDGIPILTFFYSGIPA